MNAADYCKLVERKDIDIQALLPSTRVEDDGSPLVSLKEAGIDLLYEPSIKKNYQYLVREDIVPKIGRINNMLEKEGKTLIIRSVWRSVEHQRMIWNNKIKFLTRIHPEKSLEEITQLVAHFIAPPRSSMHTTGGAVDALIFDKTNVCVLDFGTNQGIKIDLSEECYPYHPDISPLARKNRKLMIGLFEKEGFVVDLKEYWHFDYGNVMWAASKKKSHAIYGMVSS
jgi:D-alanyl-D-alanine dipeptidase